MSRYTIGRLGSYDTSTIPRIDAHLRALHMRARLADLTARQHARIRDDVDLLLDARLSHRSAYLGSATPQTRPD